MHHMIILSRLSTLYNYSGNHSGINHDSHELEIRLIAKCGCGASFMQVQL